MPVQLRSERRVAALLAHAAAVIADEGCEATTMTEIADRAGASIGSVYQYFPNREAIMAALRKQYVKELAARWASLETDSSDLSAEELGAKIIELFVEIANERPAFFPLVSAPACVPKDPAVKRHLREQFARLFVKRGAGISGAEALQVAKVTLQTIKGLNTLCGEARVKDRPPIVAEYKGLLSVYLASRLSPTGARRQLKTTMQNPTTPH